MVGDQKINSVLISEEKGQLGYELKKLRLHVQCTSLQCIKNSYLQTLKMISNFSFLVLEFLGLKL